MIRRPGWIRASALALSLLALGLAALSYAVVEAPARYVSVGTDPGESAAEAWQGSASGVQRVDGDDRGTIEARLLAEGTDRIPYIRQIVEVPAEVDGIRARASMQAAHLVPGPQRWQIGRFQLLTYTPSQGLLPYWPSQVAQVLSPTGWRHYDTVIPMPGDPVIVVAVIYNGAAAGVLHVRDVRIEAVAERPLYRYLRWALLGAWTAIAVAVAWRLLRPASGVARRATLLLLGAIALGSVLTPQPLFKTITDPLDERLQAWMDQLEPTPAALRPPAARTTEEATEANRKAPRAAERSGARSKHEGANRGTAAAQPSQEPPAGRPDPRQATSPAPPARTEAAPAQTAHPMAIVKDVMVRIGLGRDDVSTKSTGHFAAFFLIAVASYLAFPRAAFGVRVLALTAFVVSTECLQLFVVTRTASIADLVIDAAGVALGLLVGWAVARTIAKVNPRPPSAPPADASAGGP